MQQIRKHLSYANVMSSLAVFLILGGATAFAATKIGAKQLKANSVKTGKIVKEAVTTSKLKKSAVSTDKIADGAVTGAKLAGNSVDASKVVDESLGAGDLAPNSVTSSELAGNSVDSGKVVDFGLSNQDVGVLFAQVDADGTVANSSGGVTVIKLATGFYEVDFGRDISNCAFVVTQGEAGVGGAVGAITGVTDRENNVEATFTTIRNDANALVDRAFQEIVVC